MCRSLTNTTCDYLVIDRAADRCRETSAIAVRVLAKSSQILSRARLPGTAIHPPNRQTDRQTDRQTCQTDRHVRQTQTRFELKGQILGVGGRFRALMLQAGNPPERNHHPHANTAAPLLCVQTVLKSLKTRAPIQKRNIISRFNSMYVVMSVTWQYGACGLKFPTSLFRPPKSISR